jgi:hypothetical protein
MGPVDYIFTGIIAASAVASWIAVVVNGHLERRRAERRENPDLSLMGSRMAEVDWASERLTLKFTLANASVLLASVDSIAFLAKSPQQSTPQQIHFETVSWESIQPEVKPPNLRALTARSEIPLPVFPSGVTQVAVSFRLDSVPPQGAGKLPSGSLVLYYRMGGYAQKELVVEWSFALPVNCPGSSGGSST